MHRPLSDIELLTLVDVLSSALHVAEYVSAEQQVLYTLHALFDGYVRRGLVVDVTAHPPRACDDC
jgi:hypothetical protein